MKAVPIYEAVKADLKIDPERIAARPRWTFEAANARARRHKQYAGK